MSLFMIGFYDKDENSLLTGSMQAPTNTTEFAKTILWILNHREELSSTKTVVVEHVSEEGIVLGKAAVMVR